MDTLKIQKLLNCYNLTSIRFEPASGIGEGHTSCLNRAWIEIEPKNGGKATKTYIVKTIPEDPVEKLFMETYHLMKNEINMYNELRGMEATMEKHGDTSEKNWCSMIGYSPNDILVLEDLKARDYKIVKEHRLDHDHIMLSVATLGRFHAISKVYLENQPNKGSRCMLQYCDKKLIEIYSEGGLDVLSKVMKQSWGSQWLEVADKISNAIPTINDRLQEIFNNTKDEMKVLNHGDVWSCNIMFKYDHFQNTPVHAKLIDFQTSHYNSFACDLTFLLYTSLPASKRREFYSHILDEYSNSFLGTLSFYNYGGPRPSRRSIGEEMDRFQFLAMLILCSVSSPSTFTLEPFAQDKGPYNCFKPADFNQYEIYKGEVSEDLMDFVNKGII